jgi:hypothetical protein
VWVKGGVRTRPPAPGATPRGARAGRYRRVPDQAVGQARPGRAGSPHARAGRARGRPQRPRVALFVGPAVRSHRAWPGGRPGIVDARVGLRPLRHEIAGWRFRQGPRHRAPRDEEHAGHGLAPVGEPPLAARQCPVLGRRGHLGGLAQGEERRAVRHRQEGIHAPADRGQVVYVPLERGHEALLGLRQQHVDHAPAELTRLGRGLERRRHFLAQGEVLAQTVGDALR